MSDPRLPRGAFARSRASHRAFGRTPISRRAMLALGVFAALYLAGSADAAGRLASAAQRGEFVSPVYRGSDVLAEAARWIGAGNMTGTIGPWCADFVSFVLRRSGRAPLASRLAASALSYGPHLPGPRAGALAVMSTRGGPYGHVGFVEGVEPDGSVRLISGNWSHRVARSLAPRTAIVAFVEVR